MLDHIKIKEYTERNLITIRADYSIKGIYQYLKDFYSLLLQKIYYGFDVSLITLNPAKNALGLEFNNYHIKIGKDKLLISNIEKVNTRVLTQVAHSTEFELGSLAILKQNTVLLQDDIKLIYKSFNEEIESSNDELKQTFCYCESDGYIIYLVNTNLTKIDIQEITQTALASS